MAVASPEESVFYYECGNGRFRLTYFIPPGELTKLRDQQNIRPEAVKDFPDGVDLGCTDADFVEFKRTYGFRPEFDPVAIRRAFFAVFSGTKGWRKFRGSGFISASYLESRSKQVDNALDREVPEPKLKLVEEKRMPLRRRRSLRRRWSVQQRRVKRFLEALPVEKVDRGLELHQQRFPRIRMTKGTRSEKVFMRLHQRQKKES